MCFRDFVELDYRVYDMCTFTHDVVVVVIIKLCL
jgi:hypothetical protein